MILIHQGAGRLWWWMGAIVFGDAVCVYLVSVVVVVPWVVVNDAPGYVVGSLTRDVVGVALKDVVGN